MPIATARKVEALRVDFRSAAQVADMLGVEPIAGDALAARRGHRSARMPRRIDLLELVWSNLLRLYDRDAALAWLFGLNPHWVIAVRST